MSLSINFNIRKKWYIPILSLFIGVFIPIFFSLFLLKQELFITLEFFKIFLLILFPSIIFAFLWYILITFRADLKDKIETQQKIKHDRNNIEFSGMDLEPNRIIYYTSAIALINISSSMLFCYYYNLGFNFFLIICFLFVIIGFLVHFLVEIPYKKKKYKLI
ncbi:MAG: hypothetical protein A2033_09020 [Bacteroidetes bacterium GWA2_31_9]|nr:MAG: hypothetical protein A2033_09020 [Bacteroidetes bacterium GWA2_31_9]